MAPVVITSDFHSGAIEVVECSHPGEILLNLRADSAAPDIRQWFNFKVYAPRGIPQTIRILNAAQAAYPGGWERYRACVSEDGENWRRTTTDFNGQALTIQYMPVFPITQYAYFEPYSDERRHRFIGRIQQDGRVAVDVVGWSAEGAAIERVVIRASERVRKTCWIVARQHPGETQGPFAVEGLIDRLLSVGDSTARALLEQVEFHIIPDINPDGARLGNLRTNARGANLNREWAEPSAEHSPEVLAVRRAMEATGADLVLDLHGDEALPYIFTVGADDLPGLTQAIRDRRSRFEAAFLRACPDFQTKFGYPIGRPDHASIKKLTPFATQTFGSLALTLEMPFKDNANAPDTAFGWSARRCQRLGASLLEPIAADLIG